MFTDHEILVNPQEVLEALRFYGFCNCISTGEFMAFIMKAMKTNPDLEARLSLIATDLLEQFDVLETKKEGKPYCLYGHDADGKRQLLLIKCD